MPRSKLRRILVPTIALTAAFFAFALTHRSTPLPAQPLSSDSSAVDVEAYRAGALQFPGASWTAADAGQLGWSVEELERARRWMEELDTTAVMVVHRGVLVAAWGATERRYASQSMRKSLVSALVGRLVTENRLDLDADLASLGVDDHPPLTAEERHATVRHLLQSRSGIYRSALYETASWKRRKPERGTHAPGEAWFYNNWGFNALETIVEAALGRPLSEAFADWIADPLQMEDYRPGDVRVIDRSHLAERLTGNESDHAAHVFRISARDLARFGLLYLADGMWRDRRVLPSGWVQTSTVEAARPTGWGQRRYGYLWWMEPPSEPFPYTRIIARGGRGQFLAIVPELELVVVHRIPEHDVTLASQLARRLLFAPAVDDREGAELMRRLVAAMPAPPSPAAAETPPGSPPSPA